MSRKLRVAIVITRLEGGAGVLALRGARLLDPEEFEITVVSGSGHQLMAEADAAGLETVVAPELCAPIDPIRDLAALRKLGELFAQTGFDVVHTHCAKAGAVGRLAARRARIPRIVHTYHGFPFHEFQTPLRRRAYVGVERRLGRITDLALCVGSGVSVEAIRRGLLPPERIRTLDVAVDLTATTRTRQARFRAREKLGISPDAVVVGAVGRVTYQKAPEDFAVAVRTLGRNDVVGVWIGGGDRVKAAPGIRFIGHRPDVLELLPAFDVFCLPSRYEGVPLAIVEAMVCGIPVVATAVNGVADAVLPGETGLLVPPQRPDLLAEALRHLLSTPDAVARMVAAARRRVHERYGPRSLAEALTLAYSEQARKV